MASEGATRTIVYPSGADLAAASAPTLPPAPPRFSATTGWPRFAVSRSAMRRPRMSVPPPGGNGRMKRTGLAGQASCAFACQGASAAPSASVSATTARTERSGVLGVRRSLGLGRGRALFEELRRRHVLARRVIREARPRRDEPADDDVLLQAAQIVLLAHDRGLGEHARRLLERGGGDERVSRQRRLGDAEQHVAVGRGLLALALDLLVLLEHVRALDLLARDEARVARILDLHAAQHLPHDHLDVLVVDAHAL